MYKTNIILFLNLFPFLSTLSGIVSAQPFCITIGGNNGDDRGTGVAHDSKNNIIVSGYTSSFASGGIGTDFYVAKLNPYGNLLWTRTIGVSNYSDFCYGVAIDGNDNIIVAGRSFWSYYARENAYIIKFDSIGNVLWTSSIRRASISISIEQINSLTIGPNGEIIAAGTFAQSYTSPNYRVFVIKLSEAGNVIWNSVIGNIGGLGNEWGKAVTMDANQNIIVAGYSSSFGAGNNDAYVIKLDSSGNLLWTRTIGGSGTDDAEAVITDNAGNIIIAGKTNSFGAGNYDVYVAKLDSSGNLLWTRTIGGPGDDRGHGVRLDTAGNIIVTGRTNSFGAGNYDMYIIKLDENGNLLWTGTIGASGDDYSSELSLDNFGNVVLAGFTNSFSSSANEDIYIVRLEPDTLGFKEGCACNLGTGGVIGTGGIIGFGGTTTTIDLLVSTGGVVDSGGVLNNFLPKIQLDSLLEIKCFGDTSGAIFISVTEGTPPFSYLWSSGATSEDITNISAGTFWVQVTDSNGCSSTDTFIVSEPPLLTATSSKQNPSCFGETNGWIEVIVSGGTPPYSHMWNTGSTSDSIFNLSAGIYTDTITDSNGCTITISDTIVEPPPLKIDSFYIKHLSSCTTADGAIKAYISGGTPPYSYIWSNNDTSSYITNLPAGTYSITVTDSNGCIIHDSTNIYPPPSPQVSIDTSTLPVIVGNISNGTPPYSCLWNTGDTSCSITINSTGYYSLLVTDSLGCTNSDTITIDRILSAFSPQFSPCIIHTTNSTIEIACSEKIIEVSVWLPDGKLIKIFKNYNNKRLVIPILTLSQGTYIITITSENSQITHKLHIK